MENKPDIRNGSNNSPVRTPDSPRRNRVDRPSYKKDRPAPYQRTGGKGGYGPRPSGSTRPPPYNRVFVNNIAYEEKWQSLKDTFRNEVGEVTYVELFTDEHGKSRGYGVVEFKNKELCEKAVKKMNRFEINSRKLVVKEDYEGELLRKMLVRDGHPAAMQMGAAPLPGLPPPMPGRGLPPMPPPMSGLRPNNLAQSLFPNAGNDIMGLNRIQDSRQHSGPIGKTVFVANLDYKVTYSKLKEVFQLAGRVVKLDLMLDKDNKSRGMATITFEDAVEAAQAISMLNNQKLYDRTMIVKMDKDNNRDRGGVGGGHELPSGLSGIGPSLNSLRPQRDLGTLGGLGDAGLGNNPLSMLSSNPLALSSLAAVSRGMPDLNKGGNTNPLAAGLSALTQQANRLSETLQANPGSLGLGGLGGLGELARLGLMGGRDGLDQRLLEERARLVSAVRTPFSDRERIEMDIARVDNRIRDIDRSMAETERGRNVGPSLPPMPPPMQGGDRVPGSTVFVRNLPYSLTWQTLKDKFSRCGRVLFATIRMENGKSRGFGNVRFESAEQAQAAVRHFNGMDIEGRKIDVHIDNRA